MGSVQFVGQSPYAMPIAQETRAIASADAVEARIDLLTTPSSRGTVILTLTPLLALQLAGQLAAAVQQVDSKR